MVRKLVFFIGIISLSTLCFSDGTTNAAKITLIIVNDAEEDSQYGAVLKIDGQTLKIPHSEPQLNSMISMALWGWSGNCNMIGEWVTNTATNSPELRKLRADSCP